MNILELDSYNLADAVKFNDKLNPVLWQGQHMRPEVRDQLLTIAEDFRKTRGRYPTFWFDKVKLRMSSIVIRSLFYVAIVYVYLFLNVRFASTRNTLLMGLNRYQSISWHVNVCW